MKKLYITVSGMSFRFGNDFLEPGMKVCLKKDPNNEYDTEAIEVCMEGLGQVGWVANSCRTVAGECMSAGRIYDKIGDTAGGTVLYKIPQGAICVIDEADVVSLEALCDEEIPF